ncbi:MAG: efflux RND transporter periplasmic adaptor subunit [Tepidisphaeraceae bacterium]
MATAAVLSILPFAVADDANHAADDASHPAGDALLARTVPSHTAKPSFMEVGIVKEWLVKPDYEVRKGQVLGREDADVEEMRLKSLRIAANSTAAIEAAEAERDAKKVEYENKQKGFEQQAASATEVEEAKLDWEQAEANVKFRQVEHLKAIADADTQALVIEKMKLLSPVDGTVKQINIQEGEIVDPNKPDGAVTLVTNNPLWVEVKVPSLQAQKLKQGNIASVAYQNESDKWLTATIIYLDPEVDAASDKQTIRLELNNDQNRPAGLWVNVRLPSDSGSH